MEIRETFRLNDFMSRPLAGIVSNLNNTIKKHDELKRSLSSTVGQTGAAKAAENTQKAAERMSKSSIKTTEETEKMRKKQVQVADEVDRARRNQDNFNDSIRRGESSAGGLGSKVKGIVAAYLGVRGAGKMVGASDEMSMTLARLDMINDGSRANKELQEAIFQTAQKTGTLYSDMASTVSKLGILAKDSFSSNDEMIAFADQMNKQFAIGGASIQEQQAAMYQLTQAMAAGKLQGDEFRSIMENAPVLAEKIAQKMGKSKGELRELSSQGKITADVIKSAMLDSADETDKAFKKLPMTWGRLKNMAINSITMASRPLLNGISFLVAHWKMLRPVVLTVAGVIALYTAVLITHNAVEAISGGLKAISAARSAMKSGATLAEAAATTTATGAQVGFNAALLACPLTWIILIIAAVVAAIYVAITAINKIKGTSISATGIIMAAFAYAGAFIVNTFIVPLMDALSMVSNFLGNVFKHPVASVKILFLDLARFVIKRVLNMAESIEALINKIPGVKVNITSKLESFMGKIEGKRNKIIKKSGYKEYAGEFKGLSYTNALNKGYKTGKKFSGKMKDIFNPGSGSTKKLVNSPAKAVANNTKKTAKNTGKTADNVKKVKDAIDISNERLKFLRQIAERDNINKYTTAEVKLDFSGMQNNLRSDADIDGFLNKLKDTIREGIATGAEGVHI